MMALAKTLKALDTAERLGLSVSVNFTAVNEHAIPYI
jgi:hypothetical protein